MLLPVCSCLSAPLLSQDLYFLDTSSWCWVRVSTTSPVAPRARFNHASALVGNKIVFCGGWDGKHCHNDLWVFDTGMETFNTNEMLTCGHIFGLAD
jgi:hypothetical protein